MKKLLSLALLSLLGCATVHAQESLFVARVERVTLEPRGGQKRVWPTINRWTYPAFTVYFERSKVIDVVMTKADPNEIGPKPPTT